MEGYKKHIIERDTVSRLYLSSAYLAPVQYYSKLINYEQIYLESDCNYVKQTYRNRCIIVGANGPLMLIIPVDKGGLPKCKTRDVRIVQQEDWQRQHWMSIMSAYQSSPFFEFYQDDILPFYERKWKFLWDFNIEIQDLVLSLLEIDVSIQETESFKTDISSEELDLRDAIHPKKFFDKEDDNFRSVPYYQVFYEKHGFIPNLSILDLLFNMGNESRTILRETFIRN